MSLWYQTYTPIKCDIERCNNSVKFGGVDSNGSYSICTDCYLRWVASGKDDTISQHIKSTNSEIKRLIAIAEGKNDESKNTVEQTE